VNWKFYTMGESALLAEPQADAEAANAAGHAVALELAGNAIHGLAQPVPGATSLLVPFNSLAIERALVEHAVLDAASSIGQQPRPSPRLITIGVRYGGEDGPDLAEVAATLGSSEAEVVALHCAPVYRVLLLGFAPGFPYLGPLPEALRLPRRSTPRVAVPAGSVAIAAEYSGIYPATLPGGWHLLGRCATSLFDPHADPPAMVLPGDGVRFEPLPGGVVP
jgi:KipI family sensor histidine kinase inhibitor